MRSRRVLIRLAVLPLLGLVTATLVAWACVYGPRDPAFASERLDDGARAAWRDRAPSEIDFRFGRTALLLRQRSPGVETEDVGTYRADDPFVESGHVMTIRAGWPFPCLDGERWHLRDEDGAIHGHVDGLWNAPLRKNATIGGSPRQLIMQLPLRPRWPGLLANAALYGGAWWLVAAGAVGAGRLVRRRHSGRCADCGYDLTGAAHARCPECGRTPTTRP